MTNDGHNLKTPMGSIVPACCVKEVRTKSTSILERLSTARLDAGECHSSPPQVLFTVRPSDFRAVIRHHTEKPFVECTTCKKRVPTEVEAVQDALRIGQEALDKATALQDSGTGFGSWGSTVGSDLESRSGPCSQNRGKHNFPPDFCGSNERISPFAWPPSISPLPPHNLVVVVRRCARQDDAHPKHQGRAPKVA